MSALFVYIKIWICFPYMCWFHALFVLCFQAAAALRLFIAGQPTCNMKTHLCYEQYLDKMCGFLNGMVAL